MSHLGRGRGRAGKGANPQQSSSSVGSSSSEPKVLPSGRAGKSQGSTSGKSGVGSGELKTMFRGMNISRSQGSTRDASSIEGKAGGSGDSGGGCIGRGGVRGRKLISMAETIKTKPASLTSKQGDFGSPVSLVANYFRLETVPDWVLYQYRVDFNVEEEREAVLRAWLRQHRERLNTAYIFDGSMMFTSQRLTAANEPLNLTSMKDDGSPVEIQIRLIQQLNYGNAVYLQVFNILVRRCLLHLNLHLVNKNYFDPTATIELRQHNLEVWPGYMTSIRQHEKSILMCSEITHKVMRTDTALKILSECTKESGDYRRLFQQTMIGAIVLTDYNNKTYRVDDVDFSLTPLSKFKYKNDEEITYVKYYETRYQIKIRELKQPLLISRSSAKDLRAGQDRQCILVPELCRMTGLSNKMLENRFLMKDLAEITRVPPDIRLQRLKAFNRRLQNEPKVREDFSKWQMKLSADLIAVNGRQFPPETIIGGNTQYSAEIEVDWTRNMRSRPMLKNGQFNTFVVICPSRLKRDTEEFLGILSKAAKGMNFSIPQPNIIDTRSDGPADMVEAVEFVMGKCIPDLILFTFTTDRADRYAAVKKKCYVDRGVPSQVVLSRNLKSKGVMTVATKVAVQMNSKIGGAPWTVQIPAEHVMVVGYDVCHDKSKKSKSVGAVVASLNKAMSSWFSAVSFHSSGEELSDSLSLDVCKAVRRYKEMNSVLPNRIFVYRDGVGEGQIGHVYNHEVVMLKKRLAELYGGDTFKLAYIIVTKRIKTRFFNNGRNPRPGTIVDDVVTLPERYDFFLVSQSVRQGTVSPTSYNVISDNLGWGPNQIQRFTYKMTHLYYNCSASVGVPAPCQYAHKLAFMVSQSLHAEPHPNLDSRLYYL